MSDFAELYKIVEDITNKQPIELVMGIRWIEIPYQRYNSRANRQLVPEVGVSTYKGPAKVFKKVGSVIQRDQSGPENYKKNSDYLIKRYNRLDSLITDLRDNWNVISEVYFDLIEQAENGDIATDHDKDSGLTLIFGPGKKLKDITNMLYYGYHIDVDFERDKWR